MPHAKPEPPRAVAPVVDWRWRAARADFVIAGFIVAAPGSRALLESALATVKRSVASLDSAPEEQLVALRRFAEMLGDEYLAAFDYRMAWFETQRRERPAVI